MSIRPCLSLWARFPWGPVRDALLCSCLAAAPAVLTGCAEPTTGSADQGLGELFGLGKQSYILQVTKATYISEVNAHPDARAADVGCNASPGERLFFGARGSYLPQLTLLKGVFKYEVSKATTSDEEGSTAPVANAKAFPCSQEFFDKRKGKSFQIDENSYLVVEDELRKPGDQALPPVELPGDGQSGGVCKLQYPLRKGTWTTIDGGRFKSPRSYAGGHTGYDFAPFKRAESIFATAAGKVFLDPETTWAYGHRLSIAHAPCDATYSFVSFFAHNSRNIVAYGRLVQQGELIAYTGDTGSKSKGEHLHFDLENRRVKPSLKTGTNGKDGFFVNPLFFLSGYPQ